MWVRGSANERMRRIKYYYMEGRGEEETKGRREEGKGERLGGKEGRDKREARCGNEGGKELRRGGSKRKHTALRKMTFTNRGITTR